MFRRPSAQLADLFSNASRGTWYLLAIFALRKEGPATSENGVQASRGMRIRAARHGFSRYQCEKEGELQPSLSWLAVRGMIGRRSATTPHPLAFRGKAQPFAVRKINSVAAIAFQGVPRWCPSFSHIRYAMPYFWQCCRFVGTDPRPCGWNRPLREEVVTTTQSNRSRLEISSRFALRNVHLSRTAQ
jgi:hypothetical protein